MAFITLCAVPDVTFKPDFGAGKENAKAMPWFKEGSVYHSAETPRKTGFLGKTPLSEQNSTKRGFKVSRAVVTASLQIISVKPGSLFLHFAVSAAPTKPNC